MKTLGKVLSIKEVANIGVGNRSNLNGKGGRLGLSQMLNQLSGGGNKDGYEVKTDKHTWLILIDNGQSCCESWGYISSDDQLDSYIGKEVVSVKLTDKGLNTKMIESTKTYDGGAQFVDFNFADGQILQLAVYNSHNGYYGHDILVVRDRKIILQDVV